MRGRALTALAFSLLLVAAGACVGELEPLDGTGGPGVGGGADAGTGGDNAAAKTYFETNVQPMMTMARPKGTCASCHQNTDTVDGPDFLGPSPGQEYETLSTDTRLVNPDTPSSSVLLLRGDHTGDAFCTGPGTPYADCTEDEVSIVTQWIMMEAQ